jgi:hypothetical protein
MISILLHISRMTYSSKELGLLLIGLGFVLWGLNVQRKYEGFQISNSALAPPDTPATSLPDSENKILSTNFTTKLIDIKTKYQSIVNIKESADIKILKFTVDSDIMLKINTLFYDIKDFIDSADKVPYDSITLATNKDILLQLYNTTQDKVDILYKIYYTIPSIIIGTNVSINANNAINLSIVDEGVIGASIPMITAEVTSIPSVNNEYTKIINSLESYLKSIQEPLSDDSVNKIQEIITKLITYAEMILRDFDEKIEILKNNGGSNKANFLIKNKLLFLKQITTTLQTVNDMMEKNKTTNATAVNTFAITVKTTLANYNMILSSTERNIDMYNQMTNITSIEDFQSYRNPYNEESQVLKQAHEFRLKKGSYLNDIFSNMRI